MTAQKLPCVHTIQLNKYLKQLDDEQAYDDEIVRRVNDLIPAMKAGELDLDHLDIIDQALTHYDLDAEQIVAGDTDAIARFVECCQREELDFLENLAEEQLKDDIELGEEP